MTETITLHDLEFVPYINEDEVQAMVGVLANKVTENFKGRNPLFVVVLNGAFMFGADLIRQVKLNCEISFLRVSSYRGTASTGHVKELMPIGTDVVGRDIILVEDIVDTGNTMGEIKQKILDAGASSVSICSLLFKPDAFQGSYRIEFIGQEIPDRFVVGYGLDYDGLGRNLPAIYQIKPKS